MQSGLSKKLRGTMKTKIKELRKEKKIMSVPATMIDDDPVIFGSQSLEELVTAVEKHHQN